MSNETAKIDQNSRATLLGVTDDVSAELRRLLVDPSTGRLKVTATIAGGTGDVVGPASATDNAVVRFNGTTGKLIQNSAVIIANTTGNISGSQKITVGVTGTATGSIELLGTTSGTVTLKTADAAGTYTLTLPTDDGDSGEFLSTDGNGVLSWVAAGGAGTVTSVSVVTANGVSGSVADATTTPAITLTLGAITPTTVNGNTITTGTGTLTLGAGKTLTASNTLTFTGTDGSSVNFGTGGTVLYGNESITLSGDVTGTGATSITTTVAAIAGTAVSGTTGSTNVVFSTSPTLTTPTLGVATATSINKVTITAPATSATLTIADGSSLVTSGANSITLTSTGATNVTLPTTGTLATLAGTEELDNKTLDSSVGKGTWTASGTWTLPAITAGGTITLAENSAIALDPAGSADGKFSGITVTAIAGYTQAFGDLVYLDPTDSRWEAVDANAAAGADGDARGLLGMVVVAGTDGNACTILLNGVVRADAKFPTFTVNNPIYCSETAAAVTQTQPTTTDVVIRIIGAALTSDEMYFNPDFAWITHT